MKNTLNVLIAILLSSLLNAQSGQKNFIDQPYIEVTGQVVTEIIPNEIYLRITLNENDKKGRISIEKQENQMLAKLRLCDIDLEKQLSVESFNGFYQRKFLGSNELSKIKLYQLLIFDGETLGKIYQELDKINISNISIIKVDHSEIESIKKETKLKALKVAKQKATDYAKAVEQNIGKALFIQESSNVNYISNALAGEIRGLSISKYQSNETINNIDIKKIKIVENVLTRFILN